MVKSNKLIIFGSASFILGFLVRAVANSFGPTRPASFINSLITSLEGFIPLAEIGTTMFLLGPLIVFLGIGLALFKS